MPEMPAPSPVIVDEKWAKPHAVSQLELAFPAHALEKMPAYDEIPAEFKTWGSRNGWCVLQRDWMFNGLRDAEVAVKDGVDADAAWRHLAMIQGSFEPKHEHKEAAVAYLASLWFDAVRANGKVYSGEVLPR